MKNFISFFKIFICTFIILVICFTIDVKAEEITKDTPIKSSNGTDISKLFDDSIWSKTSFNKGQDITISNAASVRGIYIIWDTIIGNWTITIDGCDYVYGTDNFIHEYVNLPATGDTIVIHIPDSGAIICDLHLFDGGIIPEWVQQWQKPYEDADMLVVPTHADDEEIYFGGTLPYYAGEIGKKVQVVYFTNHWAQNYRVHELLNGLWTCKVKAYPIMGPFNDQYSDSLDKAISMYGEEKSLSFMVKMIRRFRPEVVLGHDLNGEYGHGAHKLSSKVIAEAVEISNNPEYFPESSAFYGLWQVQKTYFHLYKENEIDMEWDTPLSSFEGLTAFEVAEKAFECHTSQRRFYNVSRDPQLFGCTQFGLYKSTVGEDILKNDFFENVIVQKEVTVEAESETESETESALAVNGSVLSENNIQADNKDDISFGERILFVLLGAVVSIITAAGVGTYIMKK